MRNFILFIINILDENFDVKLGKRSELIVALSLGFFFLFLIFFILNFFVSIIDCYSQYYYYFNKLVSDISVLVFDVCDLSVFMISPNSDFDVTVNTDFENGLNICNDCIEITCQDNLFLVSRLFFSTTNLIVITCTLLLYKFLKIRKILFFKNWKN